MEGAANEDSLGPTTGYVTETGDFYVTETGDFYVQAP